MQRLKKAIFIFLSLGLIVSFGQVGFIFAQDIPENELQFSVDGGKIYFFQPETGKIFVYQITTNRLSQLLTLEKLGKDLKQSRSLSIIEEEKEEEEEK